MPWLNLLSEDDADARCGILLLYEGHHVLVEGAELFGGEGADIVKVEFEGVRGGMGGRRGDSGEELATELRWDGHA